MLVGTLSGETYSSLNKLQPVYVINVATDLFLLLNNDDALHRAALGGEEGARLDVPIR